MFLQRSARSTHAQRHLSRALSASLVRSTSSTRWTRDNRARRRDFHSTSRLDIVTPVNLADIGEGIVECEIIQWFVEPGARVEQFSPLCEVQSDKASSEISSKYNGVIKQLYYEAGDMARVGKPLLDIDTEDISAPPPPPPAPTVENTEASPAQPAAPVTQHGTSTVGHIAADSSAGVHLDPNSAAAAAAVPSRVATTKGESAVSVTDRARSTTIPPAPGPGLEGQGHSSLATPAVRHLSKTHNINITQITGTGKAGRVMKEDILRYVAQQKSAPLATNPALGGTPTAPSHVPQQAQQQQTETTQVLSPTQLYMFKTMTRSLTIPHFLYADEVDMTELTQLRARLNKVLAAQATGGGARAGVVNGPEAAVSKLSYLPFIIKAVSLALYKYPILNARVDADDSGPHAGSGNKKAFKPVIIHRALHNIGVAMDTPSGLVVPVIQDVGSRNILSIASELQRLQKAALAGKLSINDIAGGTITVSNIGNIGGTYVSPVIVEREVAILGIGRMRNMPAFEGDGDKVVRKRICNFSWSADHRVVDGGTMARAAEVVREVVEMPDEMVLFLR